MGYPKLGTWPKIIWVASRPPVPPFSGSTSKTLCGVDALATVTDLDLVTFAHKDSQSEIQAKFRGFWRDRSVRLHLLDYGQRINTIEAALRRRFQFGAEVEFSALSSVLAELEWDDPRNLLVFDDIVLAPYVLSYGRNAILSPHDCMSKMYQSHFRLSPLGLSAAKYFFQSMIARRYEKTFYHLALLIHVVTHQDRIWLQKINPRARYHVVPNADLINPGFARTETHDWDIMIWGDLSIGSIAGGTREILSLLTQDRRWLQRNKVILIGRIPRARAEGILGGYLLSAIEYSCCLEDETGKLRQARITVVPDAGGAGTKNRTINLLSSGQCLACLYPQMEGVDKACDQGAINASSMEELVAFVKASLSDGSYLSIGEAGQTIYQREYNLQSARQSWYEMVQRALSIRNRWGDAMNNLDICLGIPSKNRG